MSNVVATPQISTLMAELRIVKIGNKQMTIAVFNQLYHEKCYDENYNILYPIWGKVKRDTEYLIFQKGAELRKQRMSSYQQLPYYSFEISILNSFYITGKKEGHIDLNTPNIFTSNEDRKKAFIREYNEKTGRSSESTDNTEFYSNLRQGIYGDMTKASDYLMSLFTPNELSSIKENYRKNRTRVERYNAMANEFHNAPQLFIAV